MRGLPVLRELDAKFPYPTPRQPLLWRPVWEVPLFRVEHEKRVDVVEVEDEWPLYRLAFDVPEHVRRELPKEPVPVRHQPLRLHSLVGEREPEVTPKHVRPRQCPEPRLPAQHLDHLQVYQPRV